MLDSVREVCSWKATLDLGRCRAENNFSNFITTRTRFGDRQHGDSFMLAGSFVSAVGKRRHTGIDRPVSEGQSRGGGQAWRRESRLHPCVAGHDDHVGDTIEIAKRTGAEVISNYEISLWFQTKGLKKVHGQQHGGGHGYAFGRVKLTQAFHGSVLPDGTYGGNPCGFLMTFNDGKKVYDAADTGLFGDMRLIGEEGIDLALLPLGDNYTMGPDDALRAVKLIQPKKVVPIHYNTWELIAQDANAWAERVRAETKTEPVILKPGEWTDV
jgi:Beta-lactamase superfamily domain